MVCARFCAGPVLTLAVLSDAAVGAMGQTDAPSAPPAPAPAPQAADPASHLSIYRRALEVRREFGLGAGSLAWAESWCRHGVLAFVNGTILVMLNLGDEYLELPDLDILLSSQRKDGRVLAPGEAAWLSLEPQA